MMKSLSLSSLTHIRSLEWSISNLYALRYAFCLSTTTSEAKSAAKSSTATTTATDILNPSNAGMSQKPGYRAGMEVRIDRDSADMPQNLRKQPL